MYHVVMLNYKISLYSWIIRCLFIVKIYLQFKIFLISALRLIVFKCGSYGKSLRRLKGRENLYFQFAVCNIHGLFIDIQLPLHYVQIRCLRIKFQRTIFPPNTRNLSGRVRLSIFYDTRQSHGDLHFMKSYILFISTYPIFVHRIFLTERKQHCM